MRDALGLLGMAVFIVCVVAFAAGVTWLVVRFTPQRKPRGEAAER